MQGGGAAIPAVAGGRAARDAGLLLLGVPAVAFLLAFYVLPVALLVGAGLSGAAPLDGLWRYLADPFGQRAVWCTLRYGLQATALCLLVGIPAAIGAWMAPPWLRNLILGAAVLPLTASTIVKAFGWMILLRANGVVAAAAEALGLAEPPVRMLFTTPSLVIGTANILLPYMILPVYAVLAQVDRGLLGAAATLGASPARSVGMVVLPLAFPGIVAGTVLVFTQSIAAYAIPTLLMGDRYPVLSRQAVGAYLVLFDDARGAVIALVMVLLAILAVSAPALVRLLAGRRR